MTNGAIGEYIYRGKQNSTTLFVNNIVNKVYRGSWLAKYEILFINIKKEKTQVHCKQFHRQKMEIQKGANEIITIFSYSIFHVIFI